MEDGETKYCQSQKEVKMKSVRVCSAQTIVIHLVDFSRPSLFSLLSLFILILSFCLQDSELFFICFVVLFLDLVGEVADFEVA